MRQLIAFLLVLLVSVAGAMGKAPKKAEAQEGVVITPTSINRLAAVDTRVSVEDNNDVAAISTPDGDYLAMVVEVTRPCNPLTDPCKILCDLDGNCYVPKVTERVLRVYDTTTDPDTLIGSKIYPSGVPHPSAVEFVLRAGEPLVVVLEGESQLAFCDLACQEVDRVQLPEAFDFPYESDGYSTFDVAYTGTGDEPLIIVVGGVYDASSLDPIEPRSGLKVGVARDSNTGNFVEKWRERVDIAPGIFTKIDCETAPDGTINSVLLAEQYFEDGTTQDYCIVQIGTTLDSPGSSEEVDCADSPRPVDLPSDVAIGNGWGFYGYNKVTGFELKKIYDLFPSGPAKGACKIASQPGVIGTDIAATKVVKFKAGSNLKASVKFVGKENGGTTFKVLLLDLDSNVVAQGGFSVPGPEITDIGIIQGTVKGKIQLKETLYVESSEYLDIMDFQICTAPIAFVSLTQIDNGDEDEELFEVSFGNASPYECEPVTCTIEFVCEGGSSVAVEDGQLVEFEMKDDECEIKDEDGHLEIKGQAKLAVTCSNEMGSSAAEEPLEGRFDFDARVEFVFHDLGPPSLEGGWR